MMYVEIMWISISEVRHDTIALVQAGGHQIVDKDFISQGGVESTNSASFS